ncbi:hypothetical protein ACIQPR_43520 [Streptomyces sp. NPDC091280]|uniref:hypothetical protein n=1 Tax=Streptomyces sp. NPDC091280 TaxID=3365984 RepID=UPI00382735B8
MRKRGIVLSVLLSAAAFVGGVSYGHGSTQLKPCETEDSVNCYWDASSQGNGHGHSFVVDKAGHVTYVNAFNDGFNDSKSDDCEQGFQPACSWLAEVH